jgi:hypothetical protein
MHAHVISNSLQQLPVIHGPTHAIADFASDCRAVGACLATESNGERRGRTHLGSRLVPVSLLPMLMGSRECFGQMFR